MKKLSKEQKTKIVQSLKEIRKRPYKQEYPNMIYGVFGDVIVVLPLGIIWDLLDAWDIVKIVCDEKLTFNQSIELFELHYELEMYCSSVIENEYGNDVFFLPDTYSIDTEFCNTNKLMEEYLPKSLLNKEFVEHGYTGYGEDIIDIRLRNEGDLLNYFNSNNQMVIRDDSLMEDSVSPDWFFSDYC